jgi:hypothetical protein
VHDSLLELRRARRVHQGVLNHYKIHVAGTGQRMVTKSRATIINSANRITRACTRYNACRAALLELDPKGAWITKYLELKPEDNRGPGKEADERGLGDGSYTASWIWFVSPNAPNHASESGSAELTNLSMDEFHDAMRAEWAQLQARAERWEEEYDLIKMEMVRTWLFLENKATEWDKRADVKRDVPIDVARGLIAYAAKQGLVYRSLARSFLLQWLLIMQTLQLSCAWFYDETMFIIRQVDGNPAKFLSEWALVSTELGLPPIAAHSQPRASGGSSLAAASAPYTQSNPTADASVPDPRPRRPLPRSSGIKGMVANHPAPSSLESQLVDSQGQSDNSIRQLRPHKVWGINNTSQESDKESEGSDDVGDDYIDEEKESYNSDDLEFDYDD